MQTIAVANHKGGTGKTATAHNLGAALAREHGQRVLLVDADPQASLTGTCGVQDEMGQGETTGSTRFLKQVFSLAEVLGGAKPGHVALKDVLVDLGDNLWICPSDTALSSAEEGLAARLQREYVLRKVLTTVAQDFDVCLVDCPPNQGLLTINALTAAQIVIVPAQPTAQDLRGLSLFVETIRSIQAEINPELVFLGILLTFYDTRLRHHREEIEAMQKAGLPVLPVSIGRSVRVAEAAGACQPVVTYARQHPEAQHYLALAQFVVERLALPCRVQTHVANDQEFESKEM
ncbi:MAG: ParA family protein [Chloroflexi bacterium]|nr:ParA family protein [Chloroflexota bacterium]